MPQAVYWMPNDPYDLRPDQKRPNFSKYNWVCQANGRLAPKDAAGKAQYRDDFLRVTIIVPTNATLSLSTGWSGT